MGQRYSVVLHFSAHRLPPDQRHNPFMRRAILNEGIEAVRKAFPTVVISSPGVPSLTVALRVSAELLPELLAFIDQNQLGDAIMEGRMLKAVRDGEPAGE